MESWHEAVSTRCATRPSKPPGCESRPHPSAVAAQRTSRLSFGPRFDAVEVAAQSGSMDRSPYSRPGGLRGLKSRSVAQPGGFEGPAVLRATMRGDPAPTVPRFGPLHRGYERIHPEEEQR